MSIVHVCLVDGRGCRKCFRSDADTSPGDISIKNWCPWIASRGPSCWHSLIQIKVWITNNYIFCGMSLIKCAPTATEVRHVLVITSHILCGYVLLSISLIGCLFNWPLLGKKGTSAVNLTIYNHFREVFHASDYILRITNLRTKSGIFVRCLK